MGWLFRQVALIRDHARNALAKVIALAQQCVALAAQPRSLVLESSADLGLELLQVAFAMEGKSVFLRIDVRSLGGGGERLVPLSDCRVTRARKGFALRFLRFLCDLELGESGAPFAGENVTLATQVGRHAVGFRFESGNALRERSPFLPRFIPLMRECGCFRREFRFEFNDPCARLVTFGTRGGERADVLGFYGDNISFANVAAWRGILIGFLRAFARLPR